MDNLAKVIMVTVSPGAILPCIKILRGIDIASREENATFKVVMTFTYPFGGGTSGASGSILVRDTTFVSQLDSMWIRAQGSSISLRDQPNTGADITCTAKITITNSAGSVVDCTLVETSVLTPV